MIGPSLIDIRLELLQGEAIIEAVAAWLGKWSTRYPRLCDWVESNIEETFTFYRLPQQHHKNLKSTNMLERLNEELKRRTLLVRTLAAEIHENWIEAMRYLDMDALAEQKKEQMRRIDAAA